VTEFNPDDLHPGVKVSIDRLGMDELGVAKAIRDGELTSPQHYENIVLFAIRITGTGTAFRTKLNEHVYRDPKLYLNQEFLERCNGLPVVWEHPDTGKLNSQEFADRIVGTVLLPYIKGDEVWAIAKIYDSGAAHAMESKQLSTSPAVVFRSTDGNVKAKLEDGSSLLVEGKPSLLDHIAICEEGVWDKGREPAGVELPTTPTTSEGSDMPEMETEKRSDAAENIDKLLKGVDSLCGRLDAMEKRMDSMMRARKDDDDDDDDEPMVRAGDDRKDAKKHRKDDDARRARKDDDDDDDARKDAKKRHRKDDDDEDESFKKWAQEEGKELAHRKDDDEEEKCDDDDDDDDNEPPAMGEPKKLVADRRARKDDDDDDDDDDARKDAKKARRKDDDDDGDDDDDDDDDRRSDSVKRMNKHTLDELRRLSKLVARMPKSMTDSDYAAMADHQARADSVYGAFGERAPAPLQGETARAYRIRLAKGVQKHSAPWKDVSLRDLPMKALEIAEQQIYADAASAARSPNDVPFGRLREIRRRDAADRVITEFVGDPSSWMGEFRTPARALSKANGGFFRRGAN
jgi:Uncharacterized protein conserved in bacteria (DUF2213)